MKKSSFLTVGLIVISIGLLNAQTNQGKFLLGLSSDIFGLGYFSSKSVSDDGGSEQARNAFYVNLNPSVGYFVIDNLALGLSFNVGLQAGQSGDDSNYTFVTTQIGPFVRYYVPTSKVLPFFELGGSTGLTSTKSEVSKDKTSIIKYGGGIGLAMPLSERVMVDVLAGYHSLIYKDKEDNENNERRVMGTLGLQIGFTMLLGSN